MPDIPDETPTAEEPPAASSEAAEAVAREDIPENLLERAHERVAAMGDGGTGDGAPATRSTGGNGGNGGGVSRGGTATAVATTSEREERLLAFVKAGSIQQTRAEAEGKVNTWPHLLVIEFAAILTVCAALIIFSALVRAPLLSLADPNSTPNPSKAPWYFSGLQELLTMFHPMVAGVTIPGMGIFLLIVTPYIDKTPSQNPADRKFAISIFTVFLMFWAVLVIIGSFFRAKGFNFTFPWSNGIFFDL
ncbi:MAG TPA: menaquinol-cytochrome c reductase cytochrome b subunit [Acidimicrobiia bacterium]|nr:menaquinol-cytochrome c reductase cytochrome b subunit [Acidimicrobiia bacterium]